MWLCLLYHSLQGVLQRIATQKKESTATGEQKEDSGDQSANDSTGIGWKDNADDEVTFTWYLNFSWFPNQWGVDATSQYITEKTGVDIEFIVPAGNEAEKTECHDCFKYIARYCNAWLVGTSSKYHD